MIVPHRLLAAAAALALAGCGLADEEPPVTEADRATGAEAHPQLLAEFGGAYAGDEADYLLRVGRPLAVRAGLEGQCTFTLVNSDVVNAFAVPGCYIYVTRGLMAIVNSEAELAAVLGHELGHIVGRHSQRQQRRSLWRTLGVIAVSVVSGSERLTQIAGAAAGLFTLRYSRSQEYQADDLGLTYLREAGYDPFAAYDMLDALGRHEAWLTRTRGADEARSIPEWARTHPLTTNRLQRVEQAASATGLARGARPEREAEYLRAVDDLLYGDDPAQGFVSGRSFAHPVMRIAFAAPPGFTLTNSPQAILIEGPEGMRGEFAAGALPPGGLAPYSAALLKSLLGEADFQVGGEEARTVNGLPARITTGQVRTSEGAADVTLAVYAAGRTAYHFVLLSAPGAGAPQRLRPLIDSFRQISAEEARALRPRRIDVIAAGPGDSLRSLAERMAGEDRLAHFLMLNGRREGEQPRLGERVKIVVIGMPD